MGPETLPTKISFFQISIAHQNWPLKT